MTEDDYVVMCHVLRNPDAFDDAVRRGICECAANELDRLRTVERAAEHAGRSLMRATASVRKDEHQS